MTRRTAPKSCANCGASIPPNARACPECGADERTGWAEQSIYDGLDLPENDAESEEAKRARRRRQTKQCLWWLVGLLLIIAFTLTALGLRLR